MFKTIYSIIDSTVDTIEETYNDLFVYADDKDKLRSNYRKYIRTNKPNISRFKDYFNTKYNTKYTYGFVYRTVRDIK